MARSWTASSFRRRPLAADTRRIEDWDDWTTAMGGDEEEDGREDLAKIGRMKCHLRRTLKGPELISPKDFASIRVRSQKSRTVHEKVQVVFE